MGTASSPLGSIEKNTPNVLNLVWKITSYNSPPNEIMAPFGRETGIKNARIISINPALYIFPKRGH